MTFVRKSLVTIALLLPMLHVEPHAAPVPQNTSSVETRSNVSAPPTTDPASLAISPDGRQIVFSADYEGKYRLWLHSLDTGTARPLPGTEDVFRPLPCWSPDSKSIAYYGGNQLKRIDVESGTIRNLFNSGAFVFGCSWNRDGAILFAASTTNIRRISEQGGTPRAVLPPDGVTQQAPYFLPDGLHFLFYAVGEGIHVAAMGGSQSTFLVKADSGAVYSRSGHLLFVRDGTLFAQRFDTTALELKGEPFAIAQNVPAAATVPAVSVSATGHVVYRTGAAADTRYFKWFDRNGKETSRVGDAVSNVSGAPLALSADGRTLALSRTISGNADVWFLDMASGKLTQFTSDPGQDGFPVWSPDGQTIYFSSLRTGAMEIYRKPAADIGKEELLLRQSASRQPRDISRDGRFLLFLNSSDGRIMALQLDGNPPGIFPVLDPGAAYPQLSPDTQWVAYQSSAATAYGIYIQQFPTGRRLQVASGGIHVRAGTLLHRPGRKVDGGSHQLHGRWIVCRDRKTSGVVCTAHRREFGTRALRSPVCSLARWATFLLRDCRANADTDPTHPELAAKAVDRCLLSETPAGGTETVQGPSRINSEDSIDVACWQIKC